MYATIILVVLSVLYVSNFHLLCCLIGYRKLILLLPAFCYYMSINCAIISYQIPKYEPIFYKFFRVLNCVVLKLFIVFLIM